VSVFSLQRSIPARQTTAYIFADVSLKRSAGTANTYFYIKSRHEVNHLSKKRLGRRR
jgi:hypothetical protein